LVLICIYCSPTLSKLDMEDTEFLYQSLMEFGIPKIFADLVKMTLTHSNGKVKIQGQLSNNFKVRFYYHVQDLTCIRQGRSS
jgi:hypothetical protein